MERILDGQDCGTVSWMLGQFHGVRGLQNLSRLMSSHGHGNTCNFVMLSPINFILVPKCCSWVEL